MARLVPKNWSEFQHYKDRNPTWIKLHKKLLDDYDFHRLPLASRALAPMLWLLASEGQNGEFDADPELIAFRIRAKTSDVREALKPLIDSGFFIVVQPASTSLAEPERRSSPETYKPETEKTLRVRREEPPQFLAFWAEWPKSPRKHDRFKCSEVWRRDGLEDSAPEIIAHVQAMRGSRQWKDGFEPAPLTYLRGRRWLDPIAESETLPRELVA